MNKLWVFGDNASSIFGRTKERRYEYYRRLRNDNFPPSWSELLSAKLNLKLNNYAIEGQSNYDIFEWFSKMSDKIQENDIVFIGWASAQNFRLYDEYSESYITIRPNAIKTSNNPKFLNGIELDTINQISKNRSNKIWVNEIDSWVNLINAYSKLKGFKVFYWTFDQTLNKPGYVGAEHGDFRAYLISQGAEDIRMESNGLLDDDHFGEKGHLIQSEYFYKFIS